MADYMALLQAFTLSCISIIPQTYDERKSYEESGSRSYTCHLLAHPHQRRGGPTFGILPLRCFVNMKSYNCMVYSASEHP